MFLKNNDEYIYIYTNDSATFKSAKIETNIDYGYFLRNTPIINEEFLKNEKELGYNVILNIADKKYTFQNLNQKDKELKFKIIVDYYLTKKELELKEQHIKELKRMKRIRIAESLEQDTTIHKIISFMTTKSILKQQKRANLASLIQGKIDLSNPSLKFYFSSYNKNLTKRELKFYINDFNKMYFKNYNGETFFIKKIKLERY